MENEILDYEEKKQPIKSYRKYYVLIESIIIFPIFLLIIIGGRVFGHRKEIDDLLVLIIFPTIFLFYLATPLIRFIRKESTPQLALLYFVQNVSLVLPIVLFLYIESMFTIGTLDFLVIVLMLICLLLFIIIPHFEIRKFDASKRIHLFLIFIHLAFIFSLIGFWQYISSPAIASNPPFIIFLIGNIMSLIMLFITLFLIIRDKGRYFYLGYYIPRILFGILLSSFQMFRIWTIFRSTFFLF